MRTDHPPWNAQRYRAGSRLQVGSALAAIRWAGIATAVDMLDLGCGDGRVTRLLARQFPYAHIVGVDVSPEMIRAAAMRYRTARRVQFAQDDMQHLDEGFTERFDRRRLITRDGQRAGPRTPDRCR